MSDIDTAKWRACAPLLPDGGCEAVSTLCDEIDRLRDCVRVVEEQNEALGHVNETQVDVDRLRATCERLRVAALNAADLLESRSDKPQRKVGAEFVRREVAAAMGTP